ncbi:MAG: hypothetical protein M3419_01180 [Actinomycetota bacterium]|nr:hypothetical protein [Actinomycetota bacterium]
MAVAAAATVAACRPFDGREQAASWTAAGSRWWGHQPGRIYLGLSQAAADLTSTEATLGRLGVHRSYFGFDDGRREDAQILADHAAGRLPWVSFKPPGTGPGAWGSVASGHADEALRARARRYAGYRLPSVVTFNHEPSNDLSGTAEEFVAAYARVHDVMQDETGLGTVSFVPILGDWEINPRNDLGRPEQFLTDDVLDRSAFVGVDLYQNASGTGYDERLGRLVDLLEGWGRPDLMLGIGETGCTDAFGEPGAVQWWEDSWDWVLREPDRVGVVSYFDSTRNSKADVVWPLAESQAKTDSFRRCLGSSAVCRLVS